MWEIVNESPVGYEPAYSVVDKKTGRDISTNLDLDEAIKVKHSIEMYDILMIFNKGLADKLYVSSNGDSAFMKEANDTITKMEMLYHKMNRDYSQRQKTEKK